MKNFNFKALLPHISAVVIFILLVAIYFNPVFDDKKIKQGDIVNYTGMSKEIKDYRDQTNIDPLWTNSMFGGMPAFQITVLHPGNMIQYVDRFIRLGLPHPLGIVFMLLLGFYFLLMVLKVDPWLGVLGAIAFAFSSYFFIAIEAGHNSKAMTIAYMAPCIAGTVLIFDRRYLLGGAVAALFFALNINANHPQITYYMFLFLGLFLFFKLIEALGAKKIRVYGKSVAVLVIAVALAVGSNAGNLLSTYQYGKYSTRGKSELTSNKENKTGGLDKDYATQWSYGKSETMTLLIPDFKGGASGAIGNTNKNALKDVRPEFKEYIGQSDSYWGDQPFTSGPVYVGAVIVFFFVLGFFILKGPLNQALFFGAFFSISLAWGKNMMWLTELFLDHFPGYNKFRAVSMILVIAEFTIPLLAVLTIDKLLKSKQVLSEPSNKLPFLRTRTSIKGAFLISFGLTGGLALLYYLFSGSLTDFFKTNESNEIFSQITKSGTPPEVAQNFLTDLEHARQNIFRADAIRTFILIGLAAGILWLYFKTNLNRVYIIVALTFIVLVDMWSVNKRYLNNDAFVSKAKVEAPFQQTAADAKILEDKTPDFRVLNLSVSTFNDASTSYWHKSIGGYHGAKLKRYQELIDFQIDKSMDALRTTLSKAPTDSSIRATLAAQPVLNMLNMRYVIYNGDAPPLQNRYTLGNAWFVNKIEFVPNADAEMKALDNFNPRSTAVIDERFKPELNGFEPKYDSTASIKLLTYKPNELTYESNSRAEQLAVFSEIYYKDGWNAYVDGALTPVVRANYVLRSARIPGGKHTIVFKFEPEIYTLGENISRIMSIVLFLAIILGIYFNGKKKNTDEPLDAVSTN